MASLLNPLKKIWIGEVCTPIAFPVGKAELEAGLQDKISSSILSFGTRGLRGSIRNGKISVFWNTPGFGNAWRPVFHGSIFGNDHESRIEGKFSTFRFTQVFCGVWFGFLAIIALVALPTVVGSVGALGMMALGIGLVTFGQYLSRGEKEKILLALSGIQNGATEYSAGVTKASNWKMRIVAAALTLGGLANLVGFISVAVKGGATVSLATYFIFSFLSLLLAWGILKKKRYAWFLGFAFIGISAIYFPLNVSHSTQMQNAGDRVLILTISSVGTLVVAIYWAILWRGQRSCFYPSEKEF
jgi:hypothetical protein